MTATWTKLRDGSWGVICEDGLAEGKTVSVTRKDGTTSCATIQMRVWGDGQIAIYSIVPNARDGHGHEMMACVECGYSGPGVKMATDMSGIRAPVCRRCDDGPYNSFA